MVVHMSALLLAVAAMAGTLAVPAEVHGTSNLCSNPPQFPGVSSFKGENGKWHDIDNPYFPLRPGTTFIYEGTKDGQPVRDVVRVMNRTRMLLGVRTVVVRDLVYINGALAEKTFDYYAQDSQRNVWYFGEDSTELPSGDTAGSWHAGIDGAIPGIIMEGHPHVGDQYLQEFAAANGAEDRGRVLSLTARVVVPFGAFTQVLKTRDGHASRIPALMSTSSLRPAWETSRSNRSTAPRNSTS